MADIALYKNHTALLIADFYAEQMSKLPHAVNRKCVEKTLALRQAARGAGMLICYCATVFRPGYIEVSERNKTFSERKRTIRRYMTSCAQRSFHGKQTWCSRPMSSRYWRRRSGAQVRCVTGRIAVSRGVFLPIKAKTAPDRPRPH